MPLHDVSAAGFLAKLFDQTLTGAAASIDTGAGGIPPDYSMLEVVLYFRGDNASAGVNAHIQFNGDTGNNYDERWIRNTGDSTNASSSLNAAFCDFGYGPGANAAANVFGSAWCFIPAYDNTVGYKSFNSIYGDPTSAGAQQAWENSCLWKSTAAINRIKMSLNAGNFVTGSRLIIYGRP